MIRRSVPRMIFSSASVKSGYWTRSWPRLAAVSAASLERFLRSAPTMPGVVEAIAARSSPGSSGMWRVWTLRISSRPAWSGGLTATRPPVEAAWRERRGVEPLRAVGRADHDAALGPRDPVHLGQDLVQGLLPLLVPAEGRCAARSPDRVQLVDEDDRGGRGLGLGEQV